MKMKITKYFANAVSMMALVVCGQAQIQLLQFENSSKPERNQLGITNAKTLIIDQSQMQSIKKLNAEALKKGFTINLPNAEQNGFIAFQAFENKIMADELNAKFPEIKTYYANSLDGKNQVVFEFTYTGFHAMFWYEDGIYIIDPKLGGAEGEYLFYNRNNFPKQYRSEMSCGFDELAIQKKEINKSNNAASKSSFVTRDLRTYRLALACTGEYASFHGGTATGAMSAMTTTMNRVNGVYQKEFGVKMVMIPNNNLLIFLNAATDGYTNNSGGTMLSENQSKCTSIIGGANYDIGHVFSTGGGGIANLACVCDAFSKAQGVTGSSSPVGDPFDIDYVAHEMGHQFGGNHTFNSTISACGGGNRNASTAYEVGSGSTIMAYAGICGSDDIQPNSDPYFHSASYDEIDGNINFGIANSCGTVTASSNNIPTAIGAGSYNIPAKTPFILTGGGTDPDGDTLNYEWEQFDLGPATTKTSPSGNSAALRCFIPNATGARTFPKIAGILNGTNATNGEVLPAYTRKMTFRLVVRDKKLPVGGFDYTDSIVEVNLTASTTGFVVTAPNVATVNWYAGSRQLVTWNKSNSDLAPVNCAKVRILYSTNGGTTFTLLKDSVVNDGSDSITVPLGITTTQARIKIEAIGNIFFDISNANFKIFPYALGVQPYTITSNTVSIAPNPSASGVFNIIIPTNDAVTYEVYDLLGQLKKTGTWNAYQNILNISAATKGVYIVKISNSNFSHMGKLVYN
jgi:Metallo-peptidase family M12/Secretion system C-terminal sorting domain